MAAKAVHILNIPAAAFPLERALGSFGYPGFAYLRPPVKVDPTGLLILKTAFSQ
jgi:hypothetical protein